MSPSTPFFIPPQPASVRPPLDIYSQLIGEIPPFEVRNQHKNTNRDLDV